MLFVSTRTGTIHAIAQVASLALELTTLALVRTTKSYCMQVPLHPHSFPDVNECVDESHSCSANAMCHNTIGNYSCSCVEGFEGNGFTCSSKINLHTSHTWSNAIMIFFDLQISMSVLIPSSMIVI